MSGPFLSAYDLDLGEDLRRLDESPMVGQHSQFRRLAERALLLGAWKTAADMLDELANHGEQVDPLRHARAHLGAGDFHAATQAIGDANGSLARLLRAGRQSQ